MYMQFQANTHLGPENKLNIDMANNYVLLGRFHWPC